jgi:hypothetical protein
MSGLGTHSFTIHPTIWTRTDARHLLLFCAAAISDLDAYAISTPPGGIYTVDEETSTADCMLVENGIVLAVGTVGMPPLPSLMRLS